MACTPTPTKTLYEQVTSTSLSTSFSPSVSDLPSSVKTIQSTECVATATLSDDSTTCISTTTVEQLSTIAGGQTTVQVPVVVTVTAQGSQPTQTLYAQCPTVDSETPSNTPQNTRTTPRQTLTTPPASTLTSQTSSTMSNGSVVYTTLVVTSKPTPITVDAPTTSSAVINQQVQDGGSGGRSYARLGPQIGGTVGGVIVLVGLVGLIWWWIRRRKSWDAMFEKGIDSDPYSNVDFNPSRLIRDPNNSNGGTGRTRMSLDTTSELATEPKPYTYGIVGISHARTPSFGSPPRSPDRTRFDQSYDPYQDVAPTLPTVQPLDYFDTQPSYDHSRHTSISPLLYTPLVLPTTHISPEPSIAPSMPSSYSVASATQGPTRAPSNGSVSRPHTGNSSLASRPSTSSSGHGIYTPGPTQQQQPPQHRGARRNSSTPPDEPYARQPSTSSASGRPVSPRTLMLANWNPSTDAISLDADSPSPAVAPAEHRERRGSQIGVAL